MASTAPTAWHRGVSAAAAVALLAVGSAAIPVAPAHAQEDKNQTFIDFLDQKRIPYKNETTAIRMAKEFCVDAVRQGNPDWLAGYNLQHAGGWTQTEAETFVEGAVYVYCPKVWGVG
ncbi:DUF732 domain-containing protein [Mycolicibacterium flavescens]|uniref:DUF732 domain-containing protein n=1 Tax=Mycolicibacterium flavescens TaxID=1776 RepID=UPI000AA07E61|nr:DUF732 domain-containing protein [Mycolicibacterium flavescens]MCV7279381.1 DUF732 domain-containing protein [Mycolicibacterium flavescens]